MATTLDTREAPLKVLHQRRIVLLRKWRELLSAGRQHDTDSRLPDLLLSINAIASGLRATGSWKLFDPHPVDVLHGA
jgi:phosphoenolpyruvate carboxylase